MENLNLRKFLLLSRYGDKRFLQEIEPEIFKLVGDIDHMRIIYDKDSHINAIDPPGGPMISVGTFVKNKIFIKSIDFNKEAGDFLFYTEG